MNQLTKNSERIFSLFIGIVITLWQYKFGVSDQVDHLLFVYKAMDQNFLKNDWYTSLAAGFSVRYYYAHFMAFWSKLLTVEGAFFTFTLLSNIAVAYATFLTAHHISKSKQAGVVATVLVMTITTINMGDITTIYATGLAPDRLALPLILFAFNSSIRKHILLVALFAGLASLFHILLGMIMGFCILLIFAITNFNNLNLNKYFKSLIVFIAFISITILPLLLTKGTSISSSKFLDIYVFFRAPHHLVPSHIFANGIGLRSLSYLISIGMALYLLSKQKLISEDHRNFIAVFIGFILSMAVFGYIFIEIIPLRLASILQAFRYMTLLKWIGLVIIGIYSAHALTSKKSILMGIATFTSILSPLLNGLTFIFEGIYYTLKKHGNQTIYIHIIGAITIIGLVIFKTFSPEKAALFIGLILILIWLYLPKIVLYISMLTYVLLIALNMYCMSIYETPNNNWFSNNFNPQFTYQQQQTHETDICLQIKNKTNENAVFLAPPNFGELGSFAHRATVVCFKTVPFADAAIQEWKIRLDFCYGLSENVGFKAKDDLDINYHKISDDRIEKINSKYNISHAVLYADCPTDFPTLFSNKKYKIVSIH